MLTLVATRTLDELQVVRAVLNGDMDSRDLPPMPGVGSEAEHRNLVALAMVNGLGGMLNRVRLMSAETDGMVYAIAAGPQVILMPLPEEKPVFGFAAAARKAA